MKVFIVQIKSYYCYYLSLFPFKTVSLNSKRKKPPNGLILKNLHGNPETSANNEFKNFGLLDTIINCTMNMKSIFT